MNAPGPGVRRVQDEITKNSKCSSNGISGFPSPRLPRHAVPRDSWQTKFDGSSRGPGPGAPRWSMFLRDRISFSWTTNEPCATRDRQENTVPLHFESDRRDVSVYGGYAKTSPLARNLGCRGMDTLCAGSPPPVISGTGQWRGECGYERRDAELRWGKMLSL